MADCIKRGNTTKEVEQAFEKAAKSIENLVVSFANLDKVIQNSALHMCIEQPDNRRFTGLQKKSPKVFRKIKYKVLNKNKEVKIIKRIITFCLAVMMIAGIVLTSAEAKNYYTDADAKMIARVIWGEARGIKSQTERACIAWTILNRVDHYGWSIKKTITMRGQFYYSTKFPVTQDNLWIARDVLKRWNQEKNGQSGVGRVLPKGYMWYTGNGRHNIFRNKYRGGQRYVNKARWPYST